uniref:Phosphatidylinositol 3-kinase VPS34 n=1 Tax=Blastobotrys adeninivorans TaxID=409370 RepID=A0A060TBU9_BLAAD
MDGRAVSFCLSKEIEEPFRVKICSLEGEKPRPKLSELAEDPEKALKGSNVSANSELIVSAQLFADSNPLTLPVWTLYKPYKSPRKWNEWIELPIRYSHLPYSAQLALTVWEFGGARNVKVPYGGTTIKLFDHSDATLKRGRQKLHVWLDRPADGLSNSQTDATVVSRQEMDRLEQLIKKQEAGDLEQVEWLDNLVFRRIERINRDRVPDNTHYLYIDFVQFDFPVVFGDISYPLSSVSGHQQLPVPVMVLDDAIGNNSNRSASSSIMRVRDPEQSRENPIEAKYRRLIRSHKSGPLDKELKPNAKIRDELNVIMNFSPVQELSDDEKNMMWKFRYYLTRHKRALTKFLKSISWEDPIEAKQAVELLPRWAEIDVDDALELLGPTFTDQNVRQYAVERLKKATDHELELYLLQLVEAIKFEPRPGSSSGKSYLTKFLIGRAVKNPNLGNYLYWYVTVGAEEKGRSALIYKPVLKQFLSALSGLEDGEERSNTLQKQVEFINKLLEISGKVKQSRESRGKKIEMLRNLLRDSKTGLITFPEIPLPLDPTVKIVGCVPEESSVFKSSLSPLKVTLKTSGGENYSVIFKTGDDLRQDQLVIQIISLMDQLLLNENLDLKLTPYRILATSTRDGVVQFVPNETLAHVLSEYHSIAAYLRKHNPDADGPLGVAPQAMDTFVRSCAGYCVITYLLGVGDRHLDNLLICPDGHFFHADFGYILGRDPKPFPPMMKLPIQIIEGMGGANSDNYNKFRGYCFTAFANLRKNANLILNLFALMTNSSIPDIVVERDKAVHKVMEKFCLDMNENEAMMHFQNLINDSVNAFLPMVIDRLHNLAQYWRA